MTVDTLIHADCLDVLRSLPDKSVDLIATDPPYGLNYNNGDLAQARETAFYGAQTSGEARPILGDGEEEAMTLFAAMLHEAKRVLKDGACCCCCCCGGGPKPLFARWTLLMDEIIGFKQAVVWDKGGLGMGIHYRRSYELVLIAQNGDPAWRWNGGHNESNVWRIPKILPTQGQHPTQKPVELMREILRVHSNEGDVVVDPFMGSGTTCVAAKQMGRRYIGIELDQQFYDMAVKRVRQAQREEQLFNQEVTLDKPKAAYLWN